MLPEMICRQCPKGQTSSINSVDDTTSLSNSNPANVGLFMLINVSDRPDREAVNLAGRGRLVNNHDITRRIICPSDAATMTSFTNYEPVAIQAGDLTIHGDVK